MPKVGIEPTRPEGHRILSPARLPVPPLRRIGNSSPRSRRLGKTALLPSLTTAVGVGRRGSTEEPWGSPVLKTALLPSLTKAVAGEGGGSRGNHGFTRVHLRAPLP